MTIGSKVKEKTGGGEGHLDRYLAGAGGAVVVCEGGSVLVHLAVEQTASQRQIEHFPLT